MQKHLLISEIMALCAGVLESKFKWKLQMDILNQ